MIGRHIEQDELLYNSARKAYFSSLRAYRTYPHQLRDIFDFQQIDFRLFASGFGLKHVITIIRVIIIIINNHHTYHHHYD